MRLGRAASRVSFGEFTSPTQVQSLHEESSNEVLARRRSPIDRHAGHAGSNRSPVLTFEVEAVTAAGITPKGRTVWFSITREISRHSATIVPRPTEIAWHLLGLGL
jgi:hypothetical protein